MKHKNELSDILIELFNISIGKAASLLSEIINRKIILNIPSFTMIDLAKETSAIDDYLPPNIQGSVMVSSIGFKDELKGKASLIFPADKMRKFIDLCLNENDENQICDLNFTDIDFDIIKEVGNIILNSLIGEISNFLQIELTYTLSEVKVFHKQEFEQSLKSEGYHHILILYVTFQVSDAEITGAIIINLTISSISELLNKVEKAGESFCG